MTAPTKTPKTKKPVPCWVTCWPDWFGINGNVTVVPESDYQSLETELAAARAEADELARRVAYAAQCYDARLEASEINHLIAGIRCDLEREKGK